MVIDDILSLYNKAKLAAEKTYSPYSKFPVGATVLTKTGETFDGTNVENAAYGSTICAERTAVGNAVSNGHTDIKAIAIWAPVDSIPPCGACRQFLAEFGDDIIVIFKYSGQIVQKTIAELLPYKFKF